MGYRLNRLEPILMAVPKPMQTEFGIHHILERVVSCLPSCHDLNKIVPAPTSGHWLANLRAVNIVSPLCSNNSYPLPPWREIRASAHYFTHISREAHKPFMHGKEFQFPSFLPPKIHGIKISRLKPFFVAASRIWIILHFLGEKHVVNLYKGERFPKPWKTDFAIGASVRVLQATYCIVA